MGENFPKKWKILGVRKKDIAILRFSEDKKKLFCKKIIFQKEISTKKAWIRTKALLT